jgi:hypothetical protein
MGCREVAEMVSQATTFVAHTVVDTFGNKGRLAIYAGARPAFGGFVCLAL